MAVPLITLTATLDDVTGTKIGSAASPSRLRIDLCNFGQTLPVIQGTAVVAQIEQEFFSNDGEFSTKLWANDQITPKGTVYCITAIDQLRRPLQSGIYSLDANGVATSIDLSNATQIVAPLGELIYEIPDGVIPGSDFLTLYPPFNNQLIALYYSGIFQRPVLDYTLSGNRIHLLFQATQPNSVQVVYVTSGMASVGVPISEKANGVFPGTVYTISFAPLNNMLLGLYLNGIFQRPGIDYTVSGTTITLNFTSFGGGNIYVTYIPA